MADPRDTYQAAQHRNLHNAEAIRKGLDVLRIRLDASSDGDAQSRAEQAQRLIERAEKLYGQANELLRQAEELLPNGESVRYEWSPPEAGK